MEIKEKLIIKNFGPILEAEIDIKPFMVFIGESGSGKSVILKLLSLFRWIYKHQQILYFWNSVISFFKHDIKPKLNMTLISELENSGLIDFFKKDSSAIYEKNNIRLEIKYRSPKFDIICYNNDVREVNIEKISFISDERLIIPTLFNNSLRNIKLPYHLRNTYEDFILAFDNLKNRYNIVSLETIGVKIGKKKADYGEKFFINDNKKYEVSFHNSSSGIKSVSIIELILNYYTFNHDIVSNILKDSYYRMILESSFDFGYNTSKKDENIEDAFKRYAKVFNTYAIDSIDARVSVFIEEPELNLFPNAQNLLMKYMVSTCFDKLSNKLEKNKVNIAFSTHSPYMLSSLNCLLLAHQVANKKPELKNQIEKIVPSQYWLDIKNFSALKVEKGKVKSIINRKTKLILADKIDEVSEDIGETFDKLLELQYK